MCSKVVESTREVEMYVRRHACLRALLAGVSCRSIKLRLFNLEYLIYTTLLLFIQFAEHTRVVYLPHILLALLEVVTLATGCVRCSAGVVSLFSLFSHYSHQLENSECVCCLMACGGVNLFLEIFEKEFTRWGLRSSRVVTFQVYHYLFTFAGGFPLKCDAACSLDALCAY